MTTAPSPIPSDLGSKTFKIVRKGFDTDEVRAYLGSLELRLLGDEPATSDDQASQRWVADAHAEAARILAEARQQAEERRREQDALQTWLGDGAAAAPDPARGSDDRARAEEIVAAAQAQADTMVREASAAAQAARTDRWEGLGDHAGRIVDQAEAEARAIVAEARAQAAERTAGIEEERRAAQDELARAQVQALHLIGEAEAGAAALRAEAEPRAREHVAAILADADRDLEVIRAAQRSTVAQLHDVQALVGRLLATVPVPAPPAPQVVPPATVGDDPVAAASADDGPPPELEAVDTVPPAETAAVVIEDPAAVDEPSAAEADVEPEPEPAPALEPAAAPQAVEDEDVAAPAAPVVTAETVATPWGPATPVAPEPVAEAPAPWPFGDALDGQEPAGEPDPAPASREGAPEDGETWSGGDWTDTRPW